MAGQEGTKTVSLKELPSDLLIVEHYRTNPEFLEAFASFSLTRSGTRQRCISPKQSVQ